MTARVERIRWPAPDCAVLPTASLHSAGRSPSTAHRASGRPSMPAFQSESIAGMDSIRALLRAVVAGAGIWAGVAAVLVARDHPDLSIAGDSFLASAAQLAAGWGLIAAGLAHAARRPG